MYRTLTSAALLAALAALACPWAASAHTATLTLDCAAGHAATQHFAAPPGAPLSWTRTVDGQPSGAGQVALAAHIDVPWTPPLTGTHTVSWRLTWNTGGESGSATSPTVTLTCAPAPPSPALMPAPAAQVAAPPAPPDQGTALDIAGARQGALAAAESPAALPAAVLPAQGSAVKARSTKGRTPDRQPLSCRRRVARGMTRPGRCNKVLAKRTRAVVPAARRVAVTG